MSPYRNLAGTELNPEPRGTELQGSRPGWRGQLEQHHGCAGLGTATTSLHKAGNAAPCPKNPPWHGRCVVSEPLGDGGVTRAESQVGGKWGGQEPPSLSCQLSLPRDKAASRALATAQPLCPRGCDSSGTALGQLWDSSVPPRDPQSVPLSLQSQRSSSPALAEFRGQTSQNWARLQLPAALLG